MNTKAFDDSITRLDGPAEEIVVTGKRAPMPHDVRPAEITQFVPLAVSEGRPPALGFCCRNAYETGLDGQAGR